MRQELPDRAEQLRAKIDSKKAHIRYLMNRQHDHTPILAEIKRREEEITKHQEAILKFHNMLADLPGALAHAQSELRELETRLRSLNGKADLTQDALLVRISRLQEMIKKLRLETE